MAFQSNVPIGTSTGMTITFTLDVQGVKGQPVSVAAYFAGPDGKLLTGYSAGYRATDGSLITYQSVTPAFDSTHFDKVTLSIPYPEFRLNPGTWNLSFFIRAYSNVAQNPLLLAESTRQAFFIVQP